MPHLMKAISSSITVQGKLVTDEGLDNEWQDTYKASLRATSPRLGRAGPVESGLGSSACLMGPTIDLWAHQGRLWGSVPWSANSRLLDVTSLVRREPELVWEVELEIAELISRCFNLTYCPAKAGKSPLQYTITRHRCQQIPCRSLYSLWPL